MKFAQWYAEMDQQEPLPDAKQFSYIACVLGKNTQTSLEGHAKNWYTEQSGNPLPTDWTWRTHHMTVLFRKSGLLTEDLEMYRQFFGEDVNLMVTGIAFNKECIALTVRPTVGFQIQPAIPHITVAHSHAVGPEYSNTLLMTRTNIHAVDGYSFPTVFSAVKKNQYTTWPARGFAMAVPSRVS
jgi:hypothetical protein